MSIELILFTLFVLAELFELLWQKSPTLLVMLEKIYFYYQKSPIVLYLMHPSYILGLLVFFLTQYNPWVLLILSIKSLDIILKVKLIYQHFIQDSLSLELKQLLDAPLHPLMLTFGLLLYPYLLFLALF